jgi:hypothetical protein
MWMCGSPLLEQLISAPQIPMPGHVLKVQGVGGGVGSGVGGGGVGYAVGYGVGARQSSILSMSS